MIFPGGTKTEDQESSDASEADEVEERGGFFRHVLVHFGRYVSFFVQWGLDLAHFKAGMGRFSGLHDDGGAEIGQNAEAESDGQDGIFTEKEPCKKEWGNEEDEGDGEMIDHDVDVFGLREGRIDAHAGRMTRRGFFSTESVWLKRMDGLEYSTSVSSMCGDGKGFFRWAGGVHRAGGG